MLASSGDSVDLMRVKNAGRYCRRARENADAGGMEGSSRIMDFWGGGRQLPMVTAAREVGAFLTHST